MNKLKVMIVLTFFLFVFAISKDSNKKNDQKKFPVLKGPYLGQKPPGIVPEIFAPDIISHGFHELGISFSPDGKEMFYVTSDKSYSHITSRSTLKERMIYGRLPKFPLLWGIIQSVLNVFPRMGENYIFQNAPLE